MLLSFSRCSLSLHTVLCCYFSCCSGRDVLFLMLLSVSRGCLARCPLSCAALFRATIILCCSLSCCAFFCAFSLMFCAALSCCSLFCAPATAFVLEVTSAAVFLYLSCCYDFLCVELLCLMLPSFYAAVSLMLPSLLCCSLSHASHAHSLILSHVDLSRTAHSRMCSDDGAALQITGSSKPYVPASTAL